MYEETGTVVWLGHTASQISSMMVAQDLSTLYKVCGWDEPAPPCNYRSEEFLTEEELLKHVKT